VLTRIKREHVYLLRPLLGEVCPVGDNAWSCQYSEPTSGNDIHCYAPGHRSQTIPFSSQLSSPLRTRSASFFPRRSTLRVTLQNMRSMRNRAAQQK
jgi:hypothetical protein